MKIDIKLPPNFVVDRNAKGKGRYVLDGKSLTGVTTILGVKSKPQLIPWAAKLAYEDSIGKSKEQIEKIIKDKAWAHSKKSKDATDVGTKAHDWLDTFVLSEINDSYPIQPPSSDIKHIVDRVTTWAKNNNVKFISGDTTVFSKKYWYAGSFDFICEINGKYYLGDFKTSSGVYDREYYWQCAAYMNAVYEMTGIKLDGCVIVRTDKLTDEQITEENRKAEAKYHTNKYNKNSFDYLYSLEYEKDLRAFLACKVIYEDGGFEDYLNN